MPKLYVMVGPPGSGKTTYARTHLGSALRISLDDLRLMLSGKTFEPRIEPAVAVAGETLLEAMARHAAATGCDLVFDATNVTRERRAKPIALARRHGLLPVAVLIETPLAVAQSRNRRRAFPVPPQVVKNFGQRLEPPTIEEGFVEVIRVMASRDAPREISDPPEGQPGSPSGHGVPQGSATDSIRPTQSKSD